LWGLYIRYLAEKGSSLEDLAALKDQAIGVPWLQDQKTELAKLYFSWISVCCLATLDWEDESEECSYVQNELEDCLAKIEGRNTFPFDVR